MSKIREPQYRQQYIMILTLETRKRYQEIWETPCVSSFQLSIFYCSFRHRPAFRSNMLLGSKPKAVHSHVCICTCRVCMCIYIYIYILCVCVYHIHILYSSSDVYCNPMCPRLSFFRLPIQERMYLGHVFLAFSHQERCHSKI